MFGDFTDANKRPQLNAGKAFPRVWRKTNIGLTGANVRFGGKAAIGLTEAECPLLTQSGHWHRCSLT